MSKAVSTGRVICVGQLTTDISVRLDNPLVLGDQVTGISFRGPGGTAAIVAHNVAILGTKSEFCGHTGRDANARDGIAQLEDAGVRIGATVTTERSAEILVLVNPDGERTMVASSPTPDWSRLMLSTTAADVVFFEGWALFDSSIRNDYIRLIQSAVKSGALVAVDVVSANRADSTQQHAELVASLGADVIFANAAEAEAYRFFDRVPAPLLYVHAGTKPTTVVHRGVATVVPVKAMPVIDSTGAGDTFAAGVLAGLAAGVSPLLSANLGHRAARRVLNVVGGLLPKPATPRQSLGRAS